MSVRQFDTPCRIAIAQSPDHFHAHVEFEGDHTIQPGDRVRVHGDPIQISFGETVSFERMATVTRAGPLRRAWTKFAGYFDLAELYEVSFNPGRVK